MRFQITIKPLHSSLTHDEVAIFIVNAPNWATAQIMCTNRIERMILRPEEVSTEIVYASKEEDMIRAGSLARVETVHTFPSDPPKG